MPFAGNAVAAFGAIWVAGSAFAPVWRGVCEAVAPILLSALWQSVMLAAPLVHALKSIKTIEGESPQVIYLSPQGVSLTDEKAKSLSKQKHLILVCGRYGGIDQRFINEYVDEELSIGDYVLSGGELAAAVVIEAVARKRPGVLGNQQSSEMDSFAQQRLEEPSFTRPREFQGQVVPEILLSGNHKKIQTWRAQLKDLITLKKRPDLIKDQQLDMVGLKKFWQELSTDEKKSLGLETFPQMEVRRSAQ